MGAKIKINVAAFKEQLQATTEKLNRATRPAAQAGAQIIYDRAKLLVPVSVHPHMFHGTHGIYGPYRPGTLRDAIYQVFSEDNSYRDVSTYHISWNANKAPYGSMVELGTRHSAAHSFIGRAIAETRREVRNAMKERFIKEVTGK
ncbi:HK97-gp10 family putative phage morphogenesis protein [Azonexus sp. IMCC34839]|uniref:HK97-gp10 family putative phage morphogenesis protein n=1 Tax=Azonexus sp. IMCC34839 TaxID=3133695 RepID=UPI003999AA7B